MLKKRTNQHQKQRAFTFVEVLVATMLVALVMTALGSMMALSMRVAEANEMEQLAQLKAQQTMEFFRRERLIRGWSDFYNSLQDNATYCLNTLPANITTISPGSCFTYKSDFNFFYYSVEANIDRTNLPGRQSVIVEVNIYRYDMSGNLIGDPGVAFFTVNQTFKQY
ncbi:MAG TPA: prepilin-type N-terminal cleavage/methylation domain-containing protein [Candidatus Woesebacteria bacterium]|nr:prepilin-type N-terminal cleavage/methylation domain-containing protein [Candidatus Woesebacteria bacterium]